MELQFPNLKAVVLAEGGYDSVTENQLWPEVADKCFSTSKEVKNGAFVLQELYRCYLRDDTERNRTASVIFQAKCVHPTAISPSAIHSDSLDSFGANSTSSNHWPLMSTPLNPLFERGTLDLNLEESDEKPKHQYIKLVRSLESTLPNEIMFSLNTIYLMLVSDINFDLSQCPAILDVLLKLLQFYLKKHVSDTKSVFYTNFAGTLSTLKRFELTSVILHLLSRDEKNVAVISSHPRLLKIFTEIFSIVKSGGLESFLHRQLWQFLIKVAFMCPLSERELVETDSTLQTFSLISVAIDSSDVAIIESGMNLLAHILLKPDNETAALTYLPIETMERILSFLTLRQSNEDDANVLIVHSLEVLYRLSFYPSLIGKYLNLIKMHTNTLLNLIQSDVTVNGGDIPVPIAYQFPIGVFCSASNMKDGSKRFPCQWGVCDELCDSGLQLMAHVRERHVELEEEQDVVASLGKAFLEPCKWLGCGHCPLTVGDLMWHVWLEHCFGRLQPHDCHVTSNYSYFTKDCSVGESPSLKSVRITIILTLKLLVESQVTDWFKQILASHDILILSLITNNVDCASYASELLSLLC